LSLFVCLKAKKIDTEFVSFSESDKNVLIEPASPIFSGARATSREMSRDESAVFPDGAGGLRRFNECPARESLCSVIAS
jgi:hypothetical protein